MGTIKTTNIETITGSGTLTLCQSGETISVPSGATINLSNATQTGVGGDNTPAFYAFLSANQSIPNNTTTKVNCNTEVLDTNGAYDNSTNYRFTVPSGEAGYYFIHGQVRSNSASDYAFSEAILRVNNSDKALASGRNEDYGSRIFAVTLDLSVGDYVELFYYQDSGGSIDISGNASVHRSYLGGYKLIT